MVVGRRRPRRLCWRGSDPASGRWSWIDGFHDQRFLVSTAVLGRRPGKAVTSDDVHAVLEDEGR